MSYTKLIDSNLNKAYNLLKDQAIDVVLIKKQQPSFDFNNTNLKFSKSENISTKAIVVNTKKANKERNTVLKELMLKTREVGDLNLYSSLIFESKTWNINTVLKNDGFIVMLDVYSEA